MKVYDMKVCVMKLCNFEICDLPVSKRQDEWKRTSQSPPTAADQCEKDKTSGSAQVNVHQQRLTSVKKIRRVGAHKPKSTNSD